MNNKNRKVVIIYIIITLILLLWILVCDVVCIKQIENLDKRLDNLNQIKQDSSLIEVNGELIDADDYYQADWESYTLVKDSVE